MTLYLSIFQFDYGSFLLTLGVIHALLIYFFAGLSAAFSQGTTFLIEEYMVHDGVQGVAGIGGANDLPVLPTSSAMRTILSPLFMGRPSAT